MNASKIILFCSRLKRLTNRKITVLRALILTCVRCCCCCYTHVMLLQLFGFRAWWTVAVLVTRRNVGWEERTNNMLVLQHNRLINATHSPLLETCIVSAVKLLHRKACRIDDNRYVSRYAHICASELFYSPAIYMFLHGMCPMKIKIEGK